MHLALMLNGLSWTCFSSVHSSDRKLALAFRAARPSVLNISEDTVWLNLKLCPLSLQSSVTFYFHVRGRRRECVNSSACWPCRHGEHCWTVKAWVRYRLHSGLIFVSGRRDQQKDSLRVQLCHQHSSRHSLTTPSPPPLPSHHHPLPQLWTSFSTEKWTNVKKKIEIHTAFPHQPNKSTDFDCLLSRSEPQPLF